MHKQWCHDHKTWTSDNWKRAHDMVRWVVLHAVPYIRESLRLGNTQGSLQSCSVLVWAAISWYNSILLVPLLPFMAELLQGSMWTGWVIGCIPWSRHFWTTMQFSKHDNAPIYTPGTVHSLKSMKVNLSNFPGQHNHLFWKLVWGTDSHLQHL
jgi:hypothetical protein